MVRPLRCGGPAAGGEFCRGAQLALHEPDPGVWTVTDRRVVIPLSLDFQRWKSASTQIHPTNARAHDLHGAAQPVPSDRLVPVRDPTARKVR
jgi:hypothetical protein